MAEETKTPTRTRRKVRQGVVTSDKMEKTVTVTLVRRYAHPVYGKQVTRTKKVKARNEMDAKAGDTVRIMETRPLAKTVCWRVREIVEGAKKKGTAREHSPHRGQFRRPPCPGHSGTGRQQAPVCRPGRHRGRRHQGCASHRPGEKGRRCQGGYRPNCQGDPAKGWLVHPLRRKCRGADQRRRRA